MKLSAVSVPVLALRMWNSNSLDTSDNTEKKKNLHTAGCSD